MKTTGSIPQNTIELSAEATTLDNPKRAD